MKKQILLSLFSCLCLTMTAQTVTLGTHQNYIPVISQHGDTLVSSIAEGNQWYKNDVAIEGATGQTYICKETANYSVVVTYAASGCSSSSERLNILTALASVNGSIVCKIYPNPSNGQFNVALSSEVSGTIELELLTIDGKLIMKQQQEAIAENQPVAFGGSGIIKGVYTLRIHTTTSIVNRLIIVQ
ncbi:MAG: T9SS type A sorting domain-containing protein [Paludibacter sp.]